MSVGGGWLEPGEACRDSLGPDGLFSRVGQQESTRSSGTRSLSLRRLLSHCSRVLTDGSGFRSAAREP